MIAMRIDQQKATFEALPPRVQMIGERRRSGSVLFPAAVFANCLTPRDIAALAAPRVSRAPVTLLTLRPDGGWSIRAACPWCGRSHAHGGGTGDLPFFGHRVADCSHGGYELDPRSPAGAPAPGFPSHNKDETQ